MNRIDKAFSEEYQASRRAMLSEMATLEAEIEELAKEAKTLWIALLDAEGLDHKTFKQTLEPSIANAQLAINYHRTSQKWVSKLRQYKRYLTILQQRTGDKSEQRNKRLNRGNSKHSGNSRKRQDSERRGRRVSGSSAKGN